MKKQKKVALSHFATKSWEKPKKAPKAEPEPESIDVDGAGEGFDASAVEKQIALKEKFLKKKMDFALAYGMEPGVLAKSLQSYVAQAQAQAYAMMTVHDETVISVPKGSLGKSAWGMSAMLEKYEGKFISMDMETNFSSKRWSAAWHVDTMAERAQKMRSEMGKAPRVELMVKFAEKEVRRTQDEYDHKIQQHHRVAQNLLQSRQNRISYLEGKLREMESELSAVTSELWESKRHRAVVAAVTHHNAEGRMFREA